LFIEPWKHRASVAHVCALQELNVLHRTLKVMIADNSPIPMHTADEICTAADKTAVPVDDIAAPDGTYPRIAEVRDYSLEPVRVWFRIVISDCDQFGSHNT
jgi:hypothetical protein